MKSFFRLQAIVGALPVTLQNGTTADATQVMSDLNWIVNQVNANAAPLVGTALTNANNNFTAVQSGIAASAAANFPIASQVQNNVFNTLSSTLGTNILTARCAALTLNAYGSGQVFEFIPSQTNGAGGVTISIDGLPALPILSYALPLVPGALRAGVPTQIAYDGLAFDILGTPQGQIISGALTTLSSVLGTNTISARMATLPLIAYGVGQMFTFVPSQGNSSSATLSIDGLGSAIIRSRGQQLVGGEMGSTPAIVRVASLLPMPVLDLLNPIVNTGSYPISNTVVGNISLNNTGSFFTGPTIVQGGAGTWWVSGYVSVTDINGPALFNVRLWDGTRTVASGTVNTYLASARTTITLSGFIKNPTGNLRIDVQDATTTSGVILWNDSGLGADSQISAFRIA